MDKNTVWAIVLSCLVLLVFTFLQPIVNPVTTVPSTTEVVEAIEESTDTAVESSNIGEPDYLEDEYFIEENFTITTNNVKVTFTNRGGDIIGYELLNHKDGDAYIQMADNITESNRSFSVSFGDASKPIIEDIFNTKIIDDYTIGFYKPYTVRNSDGTESSFTFVKQYTFLPDEYVFKLDIRVENITNAKSFNFDDVAYTLRTSPQIGPYYDKKKDRYENRTFMTYNGEKVKKQVLAENASKIYDKAVDWTGVSGKYFSILVAPMNTSSIGDVTYSTALEVDNYANAQVKISRNPIMDSSALDTYYVFVGPRTDSVLGMYNKAEDNGWKLSNIRFDDALQTSGLFSWLEKALKWIMEILYKIIPNWGVSIILMTILLRLVLFPLTKKSTLASLKMQEVQPRMTEIQTKYKNNPEKMNQEMAKLYQETGYNPVSGCLPMLIQLPLIIAMFNLFNNYFEFRGAMFIPGWIPDLSVGDSVYTLNFNLPLLGNQIRILPVIYLISQLVYGKFSSATTAGANATQMKIMMYAMPICFFFVFYSAPSGLLIYWTISNVLTLVQQIFLNKIKNAKQAEMDAKKSK